MSQLIDMAKKGVVGGLVPEVLTQENYKTWSICMKNYLISQDLWDVIESSNEVPQFETEDFKNWRKKNATALHAIQVSCATEIFAQIIFTDDDRKETITSARIAWKQLEKKLEPEDKLEFYEANQYLSMDHESGMDDNEITRSVSLPRVVDIERTHSVSLLKAIQRGDVGAVRNFFDQHRHGRVLEIGSTALHVATISGQVKVVEDLIQVMSREDLEIQDNNGHTALSLAACNGITEIAKCLVRRSRNLITIPNHKGRIPLVVACAGGHKDMTYYLYSNTPPDFLSPDNGDHGSLLLDYCIFSKMFDVALDLLQHYPLLAITKNRYDSTPITTLSWLPSAFPSGTTGSLALWQQWIYSCVKVKLPTAASSDVHINFYQEDHIEPTNVRIRVLNQVRKFGTLLLKFSGTKKIYDVKLNHTYALEILRCMSHGISTLNGNQFDRGTVRKAIFKAVKHGITEFVVEIIQANPDLICCNDKNSRDIFMSAIEHRQEEIFSLIYGLDARKDALVTFADKDNNNMLHLAGQLAPNSQLSRISGAALQMQRELQWFKEVENIVPHMSNWRLNRDGETPRQVFTRNHKKLVRNGEEWMKQTANSSTVVGALIITIMFAAAFTVPGGNNQGTGFPIFLHTKLFMIFIISDAISLFAASTSVLMFLGILTSRYAEEDFLKSLPRKLIIGLSTLFFSIAAMMVAFCAALSIILHGQWWLLIPIVLLACIPVTLFALLQFPLLVEIFISTYGPGIFKRKMKRWL